MEENKAGIQILKMMVTDGDDAHTPAWNAKFKIVSGDPGGFFTVKTGTNKQEGILSTAKVRIRPDDRSRFSWSRVVFLTIASLLSSGPPGS